MLLDERPLIDETGITQWRHHLHAHPELLYDLHETAAFVAEKLSGFGCDEVATGIGRTGVVGVVHGRSGPGGRMVGLRADMDALPIVEETGAPYASTHKGVMHACGHDGHTAMLLGAARELARTRDFDGSVAFIFQPAEEGGAGARAMIEDGLFERFPVERVFGLHNIPGMAIGSFAIRPGAMMAATDEFVITLRGRGGHAAIPHRSLDPVLAGAALVQALQQVVSRNVDPLESSVLSVTQFHAGFIHNVIPDEAVISGTVRTLSRAVRDLTETRMREIVAGIAGAHGMEADIAYDRNYPVTMNAPQEAQFCARIAGELVGEAAVDTGVAPLMAGEDFSYMLEEKPGAFIFMGNGDSAPLHNARYDFDDRALAYGVSYWIRLAQAALGRN
ncbi:M20 aminoacylase family protein [Aureimonas populi]|uniref:M20 aminoacylase family protein n=1 Tax=Aureimonas populi TaxID=1701758 RepID=A0ABW5CKW7_9HYPH|nr:M20 aminoacylase family protein [Aureimonas populi]